MAIAVNVPRKSKSFVITVSFGGYNATGLLAYLDVRMAVASGTQPATIPLPLVLAGDGLSGSYTLTGTPTFPAGLYDAEARVTDNAGILLYSAVVPQQFHFSDTLA